MADTKKKIKEAKLVLEREYTVPLRKGFLKVPLYKRGKKAVKTLKEFIAQHMKIYDRDLNKVKIDVTLNNVIRDRGMKRPPAKIKVKAKKFDDGIVKVELAIIPEKIKFERLRQEKKNKKVKEVVEKIEAEKAKQEPEKKEEEKADAKEKEGASKEEELKIAKEEAKEQKHISKIEDSSKMPNIAGKRSQRGR
jgi:large subunit ribosomal protein L31e